MTTRLVVVGDALLDRDVVGDVRRVCPDAPVPVLDERSERVRPGGAGLAAVLLAADGAEVTLVAAVADDAPAAELRSALAVAGVDVVALPLHGATPEKVRLRAGPQSLLRLDRGGPAGRVGACDDDVAGALAGAGAVLVADYGRGVAASPGVRAALAALPRGVPVVWDPHPAGAEPVAGARLATPNAAEAERFLPDAPGDGLAQVAARADALAARWAAAAVAVTLGDRGALLGTGGPPLVVGPAHVATGDACGAGDRFAGAAALALARGAVVPEAVEAAVAAASAFVASGGADGWSRQPADSPGPVDGQDAEALAARVRAGGGTVVATGGCFDLLHAGHVATLAAARRLGDCLVVCLNSDRSVRRLKGADRPLQPAVDRAAVLRALDCVDAVAVFDEDTPQAVLRRLRPHVFVKGGDYAVSDLPEVSTLAAWGGQAVVVPYVTGRSTTRLLEEAVRRARS